MCSLSMVLSACYTLYNFSNFIFPISDIPVWARKEEMEYYLEAMPTMGKMNVDIEGNCSCKTYTIEWITNPGHKDILTVRFEYFTKKTYED